MAKAYPAWAYVGHSIEGERFDLDGINVWEQPWVGQPGQVAHVEDPAYHQPYAFCVYEVTAGGKTVRFAAGEFSPCIFGFYVTR